MKTIFFLINIGLIGSLNFAQNNGKLDYLMRLEKANAPNLIENGNVLKSTISKKSNKIAKNISFRINATSEILFKIISVAKNKMKEVWDGLFSW